jgi:ubiquinol-cytochrome c reductase cytochrome c1 subunit
MKKFIPARTAVIASALVLATAAHAAGGHEPEIQRQQWPFAGFKGQFDKAQLQRGFQVYKEVCSACHSLKRVNFRNLSEPGGPGFPVEAVKLLAAEWPNQIPEMNDAGEIAGKGGELLKRPARPSDPILGPYANEKAARAAQNGALPPDLTLIAKARNVHHDAHWLVHPFLMLGDIFRGYQEGGADYVYALLTGYIDAPADVKVNDGMYYNNVFPGHQLAMPAPLADGSVAYQDGTEPTVKNYARDVTAFLSWTADPSLDQRKRIGWQVMLYLLITTLLLYLGKKRIWSKLH